MKTLVTFVRHAKSYHYKKNQAIKPGPGLTKIGKKQSEETAKFLKKFQFDLILTSDMLRALETAEVIVKHQEQKPQVCEELAEYHIDVYRYQNFKKDLLQGSGTIVQARETIKFFQKILKENQGSKILVVGHGNVIRGCIGTSLGFPLRESPELSLFHCSLSSFIFEKSKITSIYYINSINHYRNPGFRERFNTRRIF